MKALLVVVVVAVGLAAGAFACTNLVVSPGASVDGSSMITYAADSHVLFGALYYRPHKTYPAGTMVDVYDWDTGHYIGKIPQATETYNVVGNVNEYGLAIGETTYGGIAQLQKQSKGLIDYGSLIYFTLQRAKTAKEAITVMTDLVSRYGYYSEGESFSIADPNEAWVMDFIGKGEYELGAVWVAMKVPDGHVSAHANQARIRTFPRNDPANCRYSPDVVSFARAHGLYTGSDEAFSFSDVYAPVNFESVRGCEMRVWSFFRSVAGAAVMDPYTDYVRGTNMTHRMPFSVKPTRKLAATDLMALMKDHLEGTVFDFSQDVGAGAFNAPYRWRPMNFASGGHQYVNERSTSTQQTGFVFVAQLRPNYPAPIAGLNWFGVDDAACTVFAPMFGGMTRIPKNFAEGVGDIMTVNLDSAFWIFNLVSNFAYSRWRHIYPDILALATKFETDYVAEVAKVDADVKVLWASGKTAAAIEYATNYSVATGDQLFRTWFQFWLHLTARYLDGDTKTPVPGEQNPKVEYPGYGAAWYDRIAKETGDKYRVPDTETRNARFMPRHKIW